MDQRRRVAVITGAASGMGRCLAKQLAQRRWRIAALDQDAHGLASLHRELRAEDQVCETHVADVTDAAELAGLMARVEVHLGPIELLAACAGIAPETPATAMHPSAIEKIIRINLVGVSNIVAAVLPGMLQRRRGHLVAISSLASFRGLPNQMGYCASKAGVNALMESLRLDLLDHNICVTTICPGWTKTKQTEGKYRDADLMSVEESTRHILGAIDRRVSFYAFPKRVVWQLKGLRFLPAWLRDRLLLSRIGRLKNGMEKAREPQINSARVVIHDKATREAFAEESRHELPATKP